MPNWCYNHLYFTGPKAAVAEAAEFINKNNSQLCDALIPYPQKFKDMTAEYRAVMEKARAEGTTPNPYPKDGFNSGGYEWRCNNWGTKWDVCDLRPKARSQGRASFVFNTAWSPPIPVVEALLKKFPKLKVTLRYYEGGCGFQGVLSAKDGEVLEADQYEYRGRRGG